MPPQQQTGGRLRSTMLMIAALGVAGGTSYMVWHVLNQAKQEVVKARKIDKEVVVVAKQDLFMGIPITPDQVQTVEVLPGTVPKEAVFADLEEVVGKTPRERILGGEPIRTERLAQRDARFGLNAVIMPGRRAMTIETDSESNIAGFLLPGSFVDVIVTIRPDERLVGAKWLTETILQQIKVLAVGDSMEGGATNAQATSASNKTAKADGKAGDKPPATKEQTKGMRRQKPTVTLEVTPEEAELLALASSQGDLHLILRGDVDTIQTEMGAPTTIGSMLGTDQLKPEPTTTVKAIAPTPQPKIEDPTQTATIIEGSSSTQVTLGSDGQVVEGGGKKKQK